MVSRLAQEIRQSRPFLNREEEAFLNLLRTAGELSRSLGAVLEPLDLTPTQYNVLRILRGAHPRGLACGEIGERMVTPVPDVTRMLELLAAELPPRKAAAIAAELTGLRKKALYEYLVSR